MSVLVFDNALTAPEEYRAAALRAQFRSYDFGHCVFHGIAVGEVGNGFVEWLREKFPEFKPSVSFIRRSPLGQVDPHFIHTDVDMGEYSCLLYLNPNPPEGDGTCFWTHASGDISSSVPHERSQEGRTAENWTLRQHVQSVFNRAVIFPSNYFHSRAIFENHGTGDDARLVQVVFGTGKIL